MPAPAPTLPHPLRRLRLPRPVRLAALLALLALLAAGLLARQAVPRRLAESSDPLSSLAAGAPSHLWDLAFWGGQQAGGTVLWRGALLACRDRRGGAYPNCTSVRLASWWGPAAPPPPIALLLAPVPAAPAAVAPPAALAVVPEGRR
jgi:hypothetical protein